ncbi:hypothetical protein BLJAPNOD_06159 [Ensifer sp. M14]|nr:hypothetical protein BLJAPNOD_06159 [Ensifer sp. M14]
MWTGRLSEALAAANPAPGFDAIASAAGHDPAALAAGRIEISRLRVENIEGLRFWLSYAPEQSREARRTCFDHLRGRERLWQGVHDRGEAYIFAGMPIASRDLARMSEHFPARLKVVSAGHLELAPGTIFDVSATADEWGVGQREELYTLLNIGKLTLHTGARIVVLGNVFSLLVQEMNVVGGNQPCKIDVNNHHIGILPTPHPVDTGISGPLDGPEGLAGFDGLPGLDGRSAQQRASIFGTIVAEKVAGDECNGGNGQNAAHGGNGRRGRTGGMCKSAEITIRTFSAASAPLNLFCQAGRGGDGGRGGKGGDGGRGGNAGRSGRVDANGHDVATDTGSGGNGGSGGRGGNGGNGGIASNIFIDCPPDRSHLVQVCALSSEGGRGGDGGPGGREGAAGSPQMRSGSQTVIAEAGQPGRMGLPGLAGRRRPGARIHVNGDMKS